MPRRDGTGPMGEGAMTGRGLGLCESDSSAKRVVGRGMGSGLGLFCRRGSGRGLGRGFGRGAAFDQTSSKTQKELLKGRKAILQDQLDSIDKQLENL